MAYDNTCKFIAENFSSDLATWLLGKPIQFTTLEPTELNVEPIRADALILLESPEFILHVEFQTDPKPDIPFRLADYRLRGHRRYPHREMQQVVVYLRRSQSPLVYQTAFELTSTRHHFQVIRLWEEPTETFFSCPGLLPFAALSNAENPEAVLEQVAKRVEEITHLQTKHNIAASAAILSGLILDKDVIQRILRQDIMRESVIYQEIESIGIQKGRQEGRQEGQREEALSLVLRLLNRRVGVMSAAVQRQVELLSLPQLEALGEAVLDFVVIDDLLSWLTLQEI